MKRKVKNFFYALGEAVIFWGIMLLVSCGPIIKDMGLEPNWSGEDEKHDITIQEGKAEEIIEEEEKNENSAQNDVNLGVVVEEDTDLEANIVIETENNTVELTAEEETETIEENYYDNMAETLTEEVTAEEETENLIYLGAYEITAYEWTGNPCANGNYPTEGYTVACNSLPLGTVLYIDGIGYRTVEDRGAEWHSDYWIDLYLGDVGACYEWGIRTRDVWIVE